jgi:chromate transporter
VKIRVEALRELNEVILLFLRLGFTAFGGPAAHIGLVHDEVVVRRKWIDEQRFLDIMGATNLIPGPNSTEMVIHLGFIRAGWPGLIAAGVSFILPAMAIVTALAWGYARYGSTPQVAWLLYGIKPVVIAVILQALWFLGKQAIKSRLLAAAGALAFGLYLLGVNELLLLFGGGLLVMLLELFGRKQNVQFGLLPIPLAGAATPLLQVTSAALPGLFFIFLKIGAVLYGSGYVLLAFLQGDLVDRLGWLTQQQLIDAVAIGQITPGPLFTTATFIGYILGGIPGSILATIGIFLPAFIFVALSNPLIPRMRNSPWMAALLDGVTIISLGLMGGVTVQLTAAAIVDLVTGVLALAALYLLIRYKVNSTWLVLGGLVVGLGRYLLSTLA